MGPTKQIAGELNASASPIENYCCGSAERRSTYSGLWAAAATLAGARVLWYYDGVYLRRTNSVSYLLFFCDNHFVRPDKEL